MLHFNGENYGRAGAGNWASVVPMVLPHIAVGRFLLHRLCSVRTFGNVFLETGAGKENAAIGNILHIGDETVVPCRIQSCDADSQQFGGFLPGKQFSIAVHIPFAVFWRMARLTHSALVTSCIFSSGSFPI